MKWVKNAAIVLVVVIVVLAGIGMLLPSTYSVTRSTMVQADSAAVYAPLSDLRTWPEWTAWNKTRYPDMQTTFEGSAGQAGALYRWEGKSSGAGQLTLTKLDPQRGVDFDLNFENGQFLASGTIEMRPEGDGVLVTWTMGGSLGWNPVHRYIGLCTERMMGPDFDLGLKQLKKRAESSVRSASN